MHHCPDYPHIEFLTNGAMPFTQCSGSPLLSFVISLACLGIVAAYGLIVIEWYAASLAVGKKSEAIKTLRDLIGVFVFCGIAGYGFRIVSMFWPCYPILAVCLIVLNWFAWKLAVRLHRGNAMYSLMSSLGGCAEAEKELENLKSTIQNIPTCSEEKDHERIPNADH